ncbi:uncharacterized protein GGS22DRAFT_198414 [Annulohypoxylon maeteangense]|uniref:uncharacterized protein n=1 Tax=Annulohypoxylon maeteangense TaxID=1927788 RepID=UPI002008B69A|nr:uncharacterized protein GGS22DRAFT_198414 [Annulohypoxylon maeteangense]KAI0879999.1 hypothetical protein GGS22DRAFT_198414 [Annulohypoxylon maeteangense]
MFTAQFSIGDATENLSRIVIANVCSAAGDYRDPSWLWPPPLHQPYCRFHFLKECSIYHLQENESFKRMIGTCTAKPNKTGKWPAAPTRVQPARRAREKTSKGQSGTPIGSRNSSPAPGDKPVRLSTVIETWRHQLQLQLPWPIYKTKIEAEIERYSSRTVRDNQQKGSHDLGFECRYCKFYPEVVDFQGSVSRRLAPPAPMHFVQLSDIKNVQPTEFGGLKFVVDVSERHETIILLNMNKLEDFASCQEKAEQVEGLSSTQHVESGKRSLMIEPIELDEPTNSISKKRRRRR